MREQLDPAVKFIVPDLTLKLFNPRPSSSRPLPHGIHEAGQDWKELQLIK